MVDGFHAAEQLRHTNASSFNILTSTEIEHEFKEVNQNIRSLGPIIRAHPVTGELIWIQYNPYDRSPIATVMQESIMSFYDAVEDFANILEDRASEHWIKLWPGTILLVDNTRVMHGRSAFTGARHICGCYMPYDDWRAKARVLGLLR